MKRYNSISKPIKRAVLIGIISLSMMIPVATAGSQEVPRISKERVMEIMDQPGVVVIDVRTEGQWKTAEAKVKGADRQNPMDFAARRYPKNQTLVLYCA
jgi:hypothetical protein